MIKYFYNLITVLMIVLWVSEWISYRFMNIEFEVISYFFTEKWKLSLFCIEWIWNLLFVKFMIWLCMIWCDVGLLLDFSFVKRFPSIHCTISVYFSFIVEKFQNSNSCMHFRDIKIKEKASSGGMACFSSFSYILLLYVLYLSQI